MNFAKYKYTPVATPVAVVEEEEEEEADPPIAIAPIKKYADDDTLASIRRVVHEASLRSAARTRNCRVFGRDDRSYSQQEQSDATAESNANGLRCVFLVLCGFCSLFVTMHFLFGFTMIEQQFLDEFPARLSVDSVEFTNQYYLTSRHTYDTNTYGGCCTTVYSANPVSFVPSQLEVLGQEEFQNSRVLSGLGYACIAIGYFGILLPILVNESNCGNIQGCRGHISCNRRVSLVVVLLFQFLGCLLSMLSCWVLKTSALCGPYYIELPYKEGTYERYGTSAIVHEDIGATCKFKGYFYFAVWWTAFLLILVVGIPTHILRSKYKHSRMVQSLEELQMIEVDG